MRGRWTVGTHPCYGPGRAVDAGNATETEGEPGGRARRTAGREFEGQSAGTVLREGSLVPWRAGRPNAKQHAPFS